MATNSEIFLHPDSSERTLKNWTRNCNSHSRPLSLSLLKDCHIRMKYTSHWTKVVSFCVLLLLGVGSGQGSLFSTSHNRSCKETSSQTSGSCSSSLEPSVTSSPFSTCKMQQECHNFRPFPRRADHPRRSIFVIRGKKVQQITRTPKPEKIMLLYYRDNNLQIGAMNILFFCLQSRRSIAFSAKNWLLILQPYTLS